MSEIQYPTTDETSEGAIARLSADIDACGEQIRQSQYTIAVLYARAESAERSLTQTTTELLEARKLIGMLAVKLAGLYVFADGRRLRECCNSDMGQPHEQKCPVKLAEEWLEYAAYELDQHGVLMGAMELRKMAVRFRKAIAKARGEDAK